MAENVQDIPSIVSEWKSDDSKKKEFRRGMTIGQFRKQFLEDSNYRAYCIALLKADNNVKKERLGNNRLTNIAQGVCFFMALFLGGTKQTKERDKFLEDAGYAPNSGAWSANAAKFISKDNSLGDAQGANWMSNLSLDETLDSAVKGFFTKNKNSITKNYDDVAAAANKMLNLLLPYDPRDSLGLTEPDGPQLTPREQRLALLKSNLQLILNGAPGTGKTWTTLHELAPDLLGEGFEPFRMKMIQFHPSYDYTDFIEGIRPKLDSNDSSTPSYTLKNGSFKEFCCCAGVIERIRAAGEEVNEDTIKSFLHTENDDDALVQFWREHKDDDPLPPFLFIIDEINRAEISKVLGEIMFCLDPDYRGAKGKIETQYGSSATEHSFFLRQGDDEFFIPSNVFIVGTMNDIDRSVEVFDFAMRRRFAWYEVKAYDDAFYKNGDSDFAQADDVMWQVLKHMQDQADHKLGEGEFKTYMECITAMNQRISEILNRNYCLGPSYFGKILEYYTGDNYKAAKTQVWDNHIRHILNEYVKNRHDAEKLMNGFYNAFFKTDTSGDPASKNADDSSNG